MTSKTTTILFAGLMLTLVASLTTMGLVNAQIDDSDQARIAMKKQKIAENFQQFVQVREKTNALENDIHKIEDSLSKSNLSKTEIDSLMKQKATLKAQIDAAYQEIDRLEKISIELYKIPFAKEKSLEQTVEQIVNKYKIRSDEAPLGLLKDVFISAEDETIYVLKVDSESIRKDAVTQQAIAVMESELQSLASDNDVSITVSTVVDESSCNLNSERTNYCQPGAAGIQVWDPDPTSPPVPLKSTIGFKATRSGVAGFVTVGHATYTLSTSEILYQPTESTSNKFGQLVVGRVDGDGINDVAGECDCSFFKMLPGRTMDNEVVSNDVFNWPITEKTPTSSQSVGSFVYMSGIASNVQTGQIVSKPSTTNRIYTNYVSANNDSGAPVGKVLSGNFKLYGIHEGSVPNSTYKQYIPYDVINSYIGPLT